MDFSQYGGPSEEWLAVEATLQPIPPTLSAIEKRDATNAFREASSKRVMEKLADKIELIDVSIPARDGFALEGRLYWPKVLPKDARSALYLHLHGGGYLYGTLASEDSVCSEIAINTTAKSLDKGGVVVLNLNYRHTPDYGYPTAWNDTQDAFVWIHQVAVPKFGIDPARIVVGGISAGAHLTASVVLEQHLGRLDNLSDKKLPPIAGQVLMIPTVAIMDCSAQLMSKMASPEVTSLVENKDAPLLSLATMRFFIDLLVQSSGDGFVPDPNDLKLNPGNATVDQVRGLPPSTFGICGLDPLRDEGILFADLLTQAG